MGGSERSRNRAAWVGLALLGSAALVAAQPLPWGWRAARVPPRWPQPGDFDGRFNFCRIMYDSVRREAGGMGWWTDYPSSDVNLSIRLSQITKIPVAMDRRGEPKHVVVRLTDPALFRCPFAMIEDAGTAAFSEAEVAALRAYLLKGGFLWVDDFWGPTAWSWWADLIGRVLPPSDYPIRDVPPDHPIFRTLYEVQRVPQIPSIQFWRASGGATAERGLDSPEPHVRAISDAHGRIMVLMTHDTDISDAWEREGEEEEFFYRFSIEGYGVGINVVLYALTH
jgi:hypothetical protein